MACCLMTPSQYLNQCWLIITEVPCGCDFTQNTRDIDHWNYNHISRGPISYQVQTFSLATVKSQHHWYISQLKLSKKERFERNFRQVIFQLISVTDGCGISCKIALRWMPLDLTDDKSTLVQVMAWCRQAASHYLSQCWPRFMSPYGVTRPQWVIKSV